MEIDCSPNTGCSSCLKRQFSLLENLSEIELNKINSKRKRIQFLKGDVIYKKGDENLGLICLNEGKVKICVEDQNENSQIIGLKKMVDFIGFHELINDRVYNTTATAIGNVSVCVINKNDFMSVVKNNSDLSMKVIKMLSDDLEKTEERTLTLTYKHMKSRIADAILELIDVYGFSNNDPKLIDISLKRKEIANLANMTTANAIRTISLFNKKGIVKTERRKIWVLNLNVLNKISDKRFSKLE